MNTKQIAFDTIRILEQGSYRSPGGKSVELSDAVDCCLELTECYEPDELVFMREQVLGSPAPSKRETIFDVRNETTLQGCERLARDNSFFNIGALNFASARKPGGGFLRGAQAQEESLARSSGLYPSLKKCTSYYTIHRNQRTALYSDRMIYSTCCPVFRNDDGTLLEDYYLVDFITSPAPNAGVIRQQEPENIPQIEPVLRERSEKILSLALRHECDVLVLGAWGCGVFQNDPQTVAGIFRTHLGPDGTFRNRFKLILFSILDTTSDERVIRPFREQFHSGLDR